MRDELNRDYVLSGWKLERKIFYVAVLSKASSGERTN
jgi:hypothetical protein